MLNVQYLSKFMSLRINPHILKNHVIASKLIANSIKLTMDSERRSSSSENLVDSDFEDDYVVKSIGAFGVWQAIVCAIAALVRSAAIWNMLSIIFLTPTTEFMCIKFENNATIKAENLTCYNNCVEYKFYEDVFEKTLISEFGLICENAWKASFSQSMLMFGFLVGVSLFGWVSDRFGRRIGLLISSVLNIIFMLAVPFAPSYWIFNGLRFLIGMASGGTMIISLVFIIEIVGPQHREAAGSLAIIPDGLAQSLLSVFAYFSVDWRMFLLEYAIASVFIYVFIICLPESPRWLMAKGNGEKALEVMTKAAKRNKLNTAAIRENIAMALDEMMVNDKEIRKSTYLDLFRTKHMALKMIISIIIWISAGACYFGINQYITFIGSNVFVTVILLGSIQIPTCPLAMMLNKKFGRKVSTVGTLIIIGITMTILMFVPPGHQGCTILGIIGFAATCTTFGVLCVYVSELFPTPLRTMAYGLSSAGAKIGAMVAPFIATINPHWIPSLIFAVLPFIASVFCVLLPETKGRKLQDTM